MERLDRFTTRFLEMTFYMQPRRVRRAPKRKNIDVAFDGTHVTSPLKKGMTHNETKLEARIEKERAEAAAGKPRPGPVEPHAGWYVKETEKRLDAAPGKAPQYVKETEYFWGWNATLARRVFLEECDRKSAPQLIMAATLSMPGIGTAEAAAAVLASIVGAGHLPGIADADKEYWANALPERLYKPARKLGWEASTEYRIDNLGPPAVTPASSSSKVAATAQQCRAGTSPPARTFWKARSTRRPTTSASTPGKTTRRVRRHDPTSRAAFR